MRGSLLRSLLEKILLIAIGIGLALLVLELGLRLLIPPPAENFLAQYTGWAERPGAFYWEPNGAGEWNFVHINSKGLRDREYTYDKPAHTFRILVIGDSFVEANQVPLEKAFTKVLENELNARAGTTPFQVVAAGVNGWGTDQETLYYENEGYKYQPDLVLVLFTPANDVGNNDPKLQIKIDPQNGQLGKPYFDLVGNGLQLKDFPYHDAATAATAKPGPFGAIGTFLTQNLYLYRFLTIALHKWAPGVIESDAMLSPAHFYYGFYAMSQPIRDEWQHAYMITDGIFSRLDTSVRAHGGQLVAVSNVERPAVDLGFWSKYLAGFPETKAYQWDIDQPDRLIANYLSLHSIPYLSLRPIFRSEFQKTGRELNVSHESHWNAEGHQLAADSIYHWLKQSGYLPP